MRKTGDGAGRVWVMAALLVLSGAGSLMLELVWTRQLKLVFGSTTLAVSTILVAYMLGIGLGGRFGGRWAERVRNGIATYGKLEIGIGLYALAVPLLLNAFPTVHRLVESLPFWPAALIRFGLALVVLILPTILMGATLPLAVVAVTRGSERLSRSIGLLYGANTLGAVAGIGFATFVLFPRIGLSATNYVAAGLDLAVGLVALSYVAQRVALPAEPAEARAASRAAPAGSSVARSALTIPLLSYGAVGFTALVYEVAWTRTLTMVFGSSIYAFATILGAFLGGIALGSLVARVAFDRLARPLPVYAAGVALIGVASWLALAGVGTMPDRLARRLVEDGIAGASLILAGLQLSLLAVLAPAFVLGALFPLLSRALALADGRAARSVGNVAFVNTVGCAAGAFAAGFILIPELGLQRTFAVAIAINFLTAAIVFATTQLPARQRYAAAGLAVVGALLAGVVPPGWDPESLSRGVYYKPELALDFGAPTEPLIGQVEDEMLWYRDGLNVTVSVHRSGSNIDLRLNGKTDASNLDRSTQLLSGHIPALFGPRPERGLIIGYASGMTAGALSLHGLDRIDIAEIEPAVIDAASYFDDANHRPLDNPAVRVLVEDGRTVLATAREPYDTIISEPSNPWISGAANLFTREYFELASEHLAEDGSLLQWIQLYGMDEDGLRSVLAALRESFPYVYGFLPFAEDSDLLLLARKQKLSRSDLPTFSTLPAAVQDDLRQLNLTDSAALWSLLRLTPAEIDVLVDEAPAVNSDDNMFVELRAPWHMYRPSSELRELFEPFKRGVLGVADAELRPEEVGAVALAHLWQRGDSKLAYALMRDAQSRGPSASAWVVEAELRLQQDPAEFDTALRRLDEAVLNAPSSFNARLGRAKVRASRGWQVQALEDVDAALLIRPVSANARELRMRLLLAERRFEEARAEAELLLESPYAQVDRRIHADAALLAGALGRFDDAATEMRAYLEVYPQSPDEWRWLAGVLTQLGRDADAEAARTNADRAARNWIAAAHRHARYSELRGDLDEARLTWEFALEREPDYAPALEAMARIDAAEADEATR